PFEHIAQRAQRTLVRTREGLTATTVIKERIDRLLKHALLVADDDVRSVELLQTLQSVVPVDHATVEVVQIRSRKTAAIQRNQRPQIWWNHRQRFEHHPLGLVDGLFKGLNNFQTLRQFFDLSFGFGLFQLHPEFARQVLRIHFAEKLTN